MLLAGAAGVSGWIYGWQWKRVATGADTTHEERLIIDLQDQLDRYRAENERLIRRIQELTPPLPAEGSETPPSPAPEGSPPLPQ